MIFPGRATGGRSGSWPPVWAVGLTCALLATVSALPGAARADLAAQGASVDAPGLTAGPFITDAGLVWESSGIMLTGPSGRATVLAPADGANWDGRIDLAWFGLDRWVQARPSGVFTGRIGGRLSGLASLSRCNPATSSPTSAGTQTQYAMSGVHLYAALAAACFPRGARPGGAVLEVDLRTGRAHVLAPIPGSLVSIAASGRFLVLAYRPTLIRPTSPESTDRLVLRVLNSTTGAVVRQVAPGPDVEASVSRRASSVQIDSRGDVLVSTECCSASSGEMAHYAVPFRPPPGWWWARAGATVGRATQLGRAAVLSDGRVAFLSSHHGRETIDVRNLLTGSSQTIIAFSGSVSAVGLALSGNGLAWAQQSSVINVVNDAHTYSCTPVALSPVELASLDLRRAPAAPVLVEGVPIPPQYANERGCVLP